MTSDAGKQLRDECLTICIECHDLETSQMWTRVMNAIDEYDKASKERRDDE